MKDLENIGNEGWELVLIKNDVDNEGKVTAIFKREKGGEGEAQELL